MDWMVGAIGWYAWLAVGYYIGKPSEPGRSAVQKKAERIVFAGAILVALGFSIVGAWR